LLRKEKKGGGDEKESLRGQGKTEKEKGGPGSRKRIFSSFFQRRKTGLRIAKRKRKKEEEQHRLATMEVFRFFQ